MARIRIYVEGGGVGKGGKSNVRMGFEGLLRGFAGTMPKIIACGGRDEAYADFLVGVRANPDDFVMLLVDAEGPVSSQDRREHLRRRDGWNLASASEEQVHLMVQAVEAWLIADPEALAKHYGANLNTNRLPATRNPEDVPKDSLKATLKSAAGRRGYSEIHDCHRVLARVDPSMLRGKCPHCRAFLGALCDRVGRAPLPERA